MSETLDKIEQFERDCLQALLDKCTPKQQELFKKMYTCGHATIAGDKIHRAIEQCEATIRKNNMGK